VTPKLLARRAQPSFNLRPDDALFVQVVGGQRAKSAGSFENDM
jgi:hypothetical protein